MQPTFLLVDVGGYRFAWCGFVGEAPLHALTPVAYCTLDKSLIQSMGETW
ncbi:MAG: hypothetical protein RL472_357, partial [Pseudomonadota bacterium]